MTPRTPAAPTKNMQDTFAVRLPTALKKKCIKVAKAQDLTPGQWARRALRAALALEESK